MTLTSEQIEIILIAVCIVLVLDYIFIIARFNAFIANQQKLNENYVKKIVDQFNEVAKKE
jgi:hypothetical protein